MKLSNSLTSLPRTKSPKPQQPAHNLTYNKQSLLFTSQMEFAIYQPSPWNYPFTSPDIFSYPTIPENYIHWTQTPESHIFSADLPGVRKEEIKVEVEDSRYLIIRTEAVDESTKPAKSFSRKFRLPDMINIDGISAGYEDGVLRVTVPRSFTRRGFFIDPADVPERLEFIARAA